MCPRCKVELVRADLTEAERTVLKALRASYRCACGYQVAPGASLAIPKLISLRERETEARRRESHDARQRLARERKAALLAPTERIEVGALPTLHQEVLGNDEVLVLDSERPRIELPPLTEESLDLGDWTPISGERPLGEI